MWNNASTAPTERIRRAQYIRTAQAAGRQREGADVIKYAWNFINVKTALLPRRGSRKVKRQEVPLGETA